MPTEKELIDKIIQGDTGSFEQLVRQYENLVFVVVSRLTGSREDAEDICQEVFMKVYRHLGSFAFQSKLSTWIAKIAYLTALNHLKKHRKAGSSPFHEQPDDFYFTEETPEQVLSQKERTAYIHTLISQMPAPYCTVITLYHLNEFSYREIEEITGMPEGTVKNYLFRARKLLKEKLESTINRRP
jgi:RNA polymerase sigma-70 factor (ECF subfamily)